MIFVQVLSNMLDRRGGLPHFHGVGEVDATHDTDSVCGHF